MNIANLFLNDSMLKNIIEDVPKARPQMIT